jgi:tetratricopeptide (TPR) repeat protein
MISPIRKNQPARPRSLQRLLAQGGLLAGLFLFSSLTRGYADPILDKAYQFLQAGRVDAATSIYKAYLAQHPTSTRAELAMAEISMRRFEYPKARAILEKALAQHPDAPEISATLGRLFQLWANSPSGKAADNSRDYLALAQEHFRQAFELGPNKVLVLTYGAEWQIQQNDLVSAERYLQKALQIHPTFVPALQAQTRFYMKVRDIPRAKTAIMHALEIDPQDQMSYFLAAQLFAMANQPVQAVKYAQKSEQLDFGHLPERDYFLASQFERLGETQKAIQYYQNLTVYTPRDANVWQKLGELYDTIGQSKQSIAAYQQAMRFQPDILQSMHRQARENTRLEKVTTALAQWRRILSLQSDQPDTVREALGAIAGLHYLHRFYHADQPNPAAEKDMQLFDETSLGQQDSPLFLLDRAKLHIAITGQPNNADRALLTRLSTDNDSAIAGEAAFLLEDLGKANERLEEVDSLSAEEYTRIADRLLLIQELVFSKVLYQRAHQLAPDPSLETAMKRIQVKQSLANQKVEEGNTAYNAKDYQTAILKYQEAVHIYRQWDNVYLRLGDTYEQVKRWADAKQAYDVAISLTPGLMDSQGFAKNYAKLSKKVPKNPSSPKTAKANDKQPVKTE